MVMTPTFERLHHDLRPIAQDLRQVFGGTSDPREMLYLWRQLLKKWNISNSHLVYRFLLAFIPFTYEDDIYDIGCAQWWLQKEDDMWNGRPWALGSQTVIISPVGALTEKYKNEDLEQAVKPAFGFWLFPIEALGALPEYGGFWFEPKCLLDMTGHWPELALLSLP